MNEINIYKSKWKTIKYILLCAPFFILSLLDIFGYTSISPDMWLNWVCVCFFGSGILMFLVSLLNTKPQIILNKEGIFQHMPFGVLTKNKKTNVFIPWNSIKNARLKTQENYSAQGTRIGKDKLICLTLDEDVISMLNSRVIFPKLNSNIGLKDYSFSLFLLRNFDEQKLIIFINDMPVANYAQRQKLLAELKL